MIDPREERELEAYLAGESPVSKRYRELRAEEPPAELDAAIVAAAERELKVVRLQRNWRRWGAAVGIAATVVLAFSLLLQFAIRPFEQVPVKEYWDADELWVESGPAPQPVRPQPGRTEPGPASEQPQAPVAGADALVTRARKQEADLQDVPLSVTAMPPDQVEGQRTPAEKTAAAKESAESPAAQAVGGEMMDNIVTASRRDDGADLDEAIEIVRGYGDERWLAFADEDSGRRSPGMEEIIVLTRQRPSAAGESGAAEPTPESPGPDQRLAEILRAYDQGERDAAAELLRAFMADYPDHPVTLDVEDL